MARTTRRKFMQVTAAAGVGYWVAGGVSPKPSSAAIETINFACIGVNGKGRSDSNDASRNGNIVAICDVDADSLEKASGARGFENAKKYDDYRKLLDEVGKQIDAVTVSTPDHNHAPASIRAMKMGKHCFTQKPLTHTIYEARRMGEVAREMKVQTEMGNQGTANSGLRQAAAYVQSGGLGDVSEVHVWTNRPIWPQGLDRPEGSDPVPDGLNWQAWLGPAPERPYKNGVYHPFKWRGWWDFGTGALGDMACHTLNLPYAACSLKDPISVVAITGGHNKETYPAWSVITFEYAATDKRPAVTLHWYDGGKRPPEGILKGAKNAFTNSGAAIIGAKGTIYAPGDYAQNVELIGSEKFPDVEFDKSPGHFEEWIRAIKEGKPAMSNFPDYAGPLTETILLGNLAVWAAPEADTEGKKIQWDAKKLEATNAPEVMHIVNKEYRKGWELEG
ncbi:MAG: Gfo/Idh/MocA family oxidoreductase [Planctomycetes bacterium]|nr:Gfo/Idh/MocA family oxidoreductase [Planctomycetota bacterium]